MNYIATCFLNAAHVLFLIQGRFIKHTEQSAVKVNRASSMLGCLSGLTSFFMLQVEMADVVHNSCEAASVSSGSLFTVGS